ncbi:hypothetical protein GG344DRAFT_71257 [Lentinula edodes]|nr:hypothetical protein GG344DRAFT_71257 [Lentinula edodes]KAJ3912090.1 hypothetical protein F5877DRAFT_72686 [Lentinula edodes]
MTTMKTTASTKAAHGGQEIKKIGQYYPLPTVVDKCSFEANNLPHPPSSYFLGTAILQFFPMFSATLIIYIIIALTALNDAYEDLRRHQAYKRVNQTEVHVPVGSKWVNLNSLKARVGHSSEAFAWD